jgi:hypothetical protein
MKAKRVRIYCRIMIPRDGCWLGQALKASMSIVSQPWDTEEFGNCITAG